jgi:hypothetical protein
MNEKGIHKSFHQQTLQSKYFKSEEKNLSFSFSRTANNSHICIDGEILGHDNQQALRKYTLLARPADLF